LNIPQNDPCQVIPKVPSQEVTHELNKKITTDSQRNSMHQRSHPQFQNPSLRDDEPGGRSPEDKSIEASDSSESNNRQDSTSENRIRT
jgi:hypothetical protein